MKSILTAIGIIVGIYVLFRVFSAKSTKSQKRWREWQIESEPIKIAHKEVSKRDYFFLSEFRDLLQRYAISPQSSNAFFDMLSAVIRDGRVYAKEVLLKALREKVETDYQSWTAAFLDVYNKLKETPPTLEFKLGPVDTSSPKIYLTALESWASKFGLEKELKENPEKTAIKIIGKNLYQYGIFSVLEKLEYFKNNLEKESAHNNFEMLGKIYELIEKELEDVN